jgi:transcriptional regulator with XRE-family HTH domain
MGRKHQQTLRNLSSKLHQIRVLLGLTECEMIERLGRPRSVSERHIRAYELGKCEPSLAVLLRYARIASVPLDLLADDELRLPERLPSQGAPKEGMCPYCRSTDSQVKDGRNGAGSQRYLCRRCRRHYTPRPLRIGHPEEVRQRAILLQQGGKSSWAISQEIGVSHQTVINWIRAYYSRGAAGVKV